MTTARAGWSGRAVAVVVAVVLVVGGGVVLVVLDAREDRMATAAEPTAWAERVAMADLLNETAEALGIETTVREAHTGILTCPRTRGGNGTQFRIPGFDGPVLHDVEGGLARVRVFWEERGLEVRDRGFGPASGLLGVSEFGSTVIILSGPGGTVAYGETFCAAVSGRPESMRPDAG